MPMSVSSTRPINKKRVAKWMHRGLDSLACVVRPPGQTAAPLAYRLWPRSSTAGCRALAVLDICRPVIMDRMNRLYALKI